MKKIILWSSYVLFLIGIAYLVTEGFYMVRFWMWILG